MEEIRTKLVVSLVKLPAFYAIRKFTSFRKPATGSYTDLDECSQHTQTLFRMVDFESYFRFLPLFGILIGTQQCMEYDITIN